MKSSVVRPALFGLGTGLMIGALLLVVSAFRGYRLECENLPPDECQLEQQSAAEMGRLQSVAALGMALGSVAVFLLLRKRTTPPTPT